MADCETRARANLAFIAGRQRDGDAGRNERSSAWCDLDRRACRHRGEEIEARGVRAVVGRQRQISRMRQPHDAQLDAHRLAPSKLAAMRAIKARATSSLDCDGQSSTLLAVIK